MPTPSIQTLRADAQQVLNLDSISAVRSVVAATLANANAGTPLNPNLTTQQLWNEFYQIVTQPKSDIESIIANQLMKFMYAPPAPGGAGADKQVIFNDGGVLAGDPQFLWNKTTNLLTVTGSATITGDLTVDTSTLKVDSANNRVIIGHTSGSSAFQVTNAGAAGLEIQPTGFSSAPLILSYNRSGSAYTQLTLDGSTIVHALNGTTAMTLNATGLGVGASPTTDCKLTVRGGSIFDRGASGGSSQLLLSLGASSGGNFGQISNTGTRWALGFGSTLTTVGTEALIWDTSGNVGIGVTPSAWASGAFQVGSYAGLTENSSLGSAELTYNCYRSSGSTWNYINTDTACRYRQWNSTHAWFNAPSGTAGNAITFTQAMTLDASGYLLLGTTDTTFTSGAGYKFGPGATPSNGQVGASSSNGDLTLRVYSTGAAAYRFYVGYGGTVFATSATISAISDSRFKENVQDIDVGLSAILALKPRKFDWKAGKGKDIKGDRGFIAQEFETVFPNLIDEWADPAPEGEAPYKSVRADLIPVLVKAIQELTARVQTLEAR